MRNAITKATALALLLAPALVRAELKIGYVDLQRALYEVEEGKAASASLKKDFDEKQKQINSKKADFDKAQADFEKQAVVMSEEAKRDRAQELDKRARDLQTLFVSLQKDISEREQKTMRSIMDKMATIVREMAESDGFTYVLEKNTGIVYAPAALDLTNELIRKYNARYPASAASKAEAAAPAGSKPAAPKPAAAPKKK